MEKIAESHRVIDLNSINSDRLAVEIYPPTTELIDDMNAYHLWVLPIGFKLPFGLNAGWSK